MWHMLGLLAGFLTLGACITVALVKNAYGRGRYAGYYDGVKQGYIDADRESDTPLRRDTYHTVTHPRYGVGTVRIPLKRVHEPKLDYDFDKLDLEVCPQAAAMFPIQEGF